MVGFNTRRIGAYSGYADTSGPLGGPEIEVESPVSSSPRIYRVGQAVIVLYDPADPRRAQIRSGCLQYALPPSFIGLGTALFLFGSAFGVGAWFLLRALP